MDRGTRFTKAWKVVIGKENSSRFIDNRKAIKRQSA